MKLIEKYFSIIHDNSDPNVDEEANSKKPPVKADVPFFPNVEMVLEAYGIDMPPNGIELNPPEFKITKNRVSVNYKGLKIGIPIEIKRYHWHIVYCRIGENQLMCAPIDDMN